MDFFKGLSMSHGKSTILVVVNHLSKFAHFTALSHPYTAKIVAKKCVDTIANCHITRHALFNGQ